MAASAGGIHAHHFACSRLRPRARTRYSTVKLVQSAYGTIASRFAAAMIQTRASRAGDGPRAASRDRDIAIVSGRPEPQGNPCKADQAGHQKRRAPSVARRHGHGHRRRYHEPETHRPLIHRIAEPAFGGRHVAVNRLAGGGNTGCFGESERHPAGRQSRDAGGKARRDPGARPQGDRDRRRAPQSDAVHQKVRRTEPPAYKKGRMR